MSASDGKAAFMSRYARDINCLSDSDKFKRKRALQVLNDVLFADDTASWEVSREIVTIDIQKPLISTLSDASEMNRELGVSLVIRLLKVDEANGTYSLHATLYPILIHVLSARIGKVPCVEDAEEIRLHLSRILKQLIAAEVTKDLSARYASEITDILRCLFGDAFPDVKVIAAECVELFCKAAPQQIGKHLQPLIQAAAASLSHQRSPVRLAALQAITACLPLGNESLDKVMGDIVIPALRTMRFDRTASLRRHVGMSCTELIKTLPSFARTEETESQLLYIVCGLIGDEAAEVGSQALISLIGAADAAHVGEQAAAKQSSTHVPTDMEVAAEAARIDEVAAMSVAGGGILDGGEVVGSTDTITATIHFKPFGDHPITPSTYALVRRRLPGIVKLCLHDLKDWTAKSRVFGAAALRSLFPLAQGDLTGFLNDIIAALCTGSRDEDLDARRLLGDAGRLLGCYIPAEAQLGVLLPQLRGEVSGLNNGQHHAAALAVLTAALSDMPSSQILTHVRAIVDTLCGAQLVEDDPPQLRVQFAAAVHTFFEQGLPEHCTADRPHDAVEEDMCNLLDADILDGVIQLLLHLYHQSDHDDIQRLRELCSATLALRFDAQDAAHVIAHRVVPLLDVFTRDSASWTRDSINRKNFDALLRHFRRALAGMDSKEGNTAIHLISDCFAVTLSPSRDAELKVAMLALLDAFLAHTHIVRAPSTAAVALPHMDVQPLVVDADDTPTYAATDAVVDELIRSVSSEIITGVLLPNIVWRVGLVASTIRKASVSCVVTILRRHLISATDLSSIFEGIYPTLVGALSDDDTMTRELSTTLFGAAFDLLGTLITDELCFKLYPEIIKRVDDSNDSVRLAAFSTLSKLAKHAQPDILRGTTARYVVDTLLIHLDDSNVQIQRAACECLLPWAAVEAEYSKRVLEAALPKQRNPEFVNTLLRSLITL